MYSLYGEPYLIANYIFLVTRTFESTLQRFLEGFEARAKNVFFFTPLYQYIVN
jgi:hypothetical protein